MEELCDIDFDAESIYTFIDRCLIKHSNKNIECNLGNKTIDGVQLNFKMMMKYDGNNYYVTIPIPENYPDTPVLKYLQNEEKEDIFYMNLSFRNTISTGAFKEASKIFPVSGKKAFFLHAFYVHPKYDRNLELSESEKKVFNGLGKKCFCLSLAIIRVIFKKKFIPSETLMFLEASGGNIQTKEDYERVQYYIEQGLLEKKAKKAVILDNNDKLINYYIKSFGFVRVNETRMNSDLLVAKVDQVYDSCGYLNLLFKTKQKTRKRKRV